MYLPTLTRTAPYKRSGRNTWKAPEGSCPTVAFTFGMNFDLDNHCARDERDFEYAGAEKKGGIGRIVSVG